MANVSGQCDDRFNTIRDILAASLDSGADLGASVAVTIDGEMVVDLWGGYLDEARTTPWQSDTIVNVYSTTKTMSFLCALLLADRGELDFNAPVSRYWPEFAAAGKEGVLVWHLMNHAAGLSGLEALVAPADVYNWEKITGLLAAQAPWWEPGTATGYHALTQGFLIGEVVKRISGKSIGRFFRDEIAGPLSADFYIGVPDSEFARIGDLIPPDSDTVATPGDDDSIAAKTYRSPVVSARQSRASEWRRAEIPAANGHGNARSVAKIHSWLACGGETQGLRLMKEETARSVMRERIRGTDMVLGVPIGFGLGFGLNSREQPMAPNPNVCFWSGWGGSNAVIDQDARMSFSYVMNRMHPVLMGDTRSATLLQAVYQSMAS